jgi:hypothetical protein
MTTRREDDDPSATEGHRRRLRIAVSTGSGDCWSIAQKQRKYRCRSLGRRHCAPRPGLEVGLHEMRDHRRSPAEMGCDRGRCGAAPSSTPLRAFETRRKAFWTRLWRQWRLLSQEMCNDFNGASSSARQSMTLLRSRGRHRAYIFIINWRSSCNLMSDTATSDCLSPQRGKGPDRHPIPPMTLAVGALFFERIQAGPAPHSAW